MAAARGHRIAHRDTAVWSRPSHRAVASAGRVARSMTGAGGAGETERAVRVVVVVRRALRAAGSGVSSGAVARAGGAASPVAGTGDSRQAEGAVGIVVVVGRALIADRAGVAGVADAESAGEKPVAGAVLGRRGASAHKRPNQSECQHPS